LKEDQWDNQVNSGMSIRWTFE